jgi:hypothetical protein
MFDGDWTLKNPLNAEGIRRQADHSARPLPLVGLGQGLSGENLVRFLRDEVFPSMPKWAQARRGQLHGRRAAGRSTSPRC